MTRTFMILMILLLVGFGTVPSARAGEEAEPSGEAEDKPTVKVTLVLKGKQALEATLIRGDKDGKLYVRSPYGAQEFARGSYEEVRAQMPSEFAMAEGMYKSKRYGAAEKKYQEIYETYEHLYIFGDDALDGRGRALIALKEWTKALAVYNRLSRDYTGKDLTSARRYHRALALKNVGGKANREEAIAELERVIAVTDGVLTVLAFDLIGRIHFVQEEYNLALSRFLQIFLLYRGYQGEGAQEVRAQVEQARRNAISCCDKLIKKTKSKATKQRYERIKSRIARAAV